MTLHERILRWKNLKTEVAEEWGLILVEFSKILREENETIHSLQVQYGIPHNHIRRHLRSRGLFSKTIRRKSWTIHELNVLVQRRYNGATYDELAKEFSVTPVACRKAYYRWRK